MKGMKAVIDTNVLLVANGSHDDISDACRERCIEGLRQQMAGGVTVLDDEHRILHEYLKATTPNRPKGVGDLFLKWLLRNQGNRARVHAVRITELVSQVFAEFPDQVLQDEFDPSDRMFAAVANADPDKPPIWEAADCKWLAWWPSLQQGGVRVEFLCPDDICRFYTQKFPGQAVPALPEVDS